MKPKKIADIRLLVRVAETPSVAPFRDFGARFDFTAGAYRVRVAGITGTSSMSERAAIESWVRAARKRIAQAEDDCPGHVASATDAKVCGRCGIHIDELRPDDPARIDFVAGEQP